MSAFRKIARWFGIGRGAVAAKYDAAQTTSQNRNHWSLADALSAGSANSPSVRKVLRERARYEVANNGYLKGMTRTLANDVVGIGPTLQVRTQRQRLNALLEARWKAWAEAVSLATKLRTMRVAKMVDGEAFALLTSNRRLTTPVKLDLRLLEADQFESPFPMSSTELANGIRFDDAGNPVSYFVLRAHPGDAYAQFSMLAHDEVDAEFVLHYFEPARPGEIRGIPEITATLSLGADGRRYRNAVVAAAETAANMAMVVHTDAAAGEEQPTPYDTISFVRNQAAVLPEGWKLGQAKPEQPVTTHSEFVRSILIETARPLCMPYNVAAGDSSAYNYASGRLDHQAYFKAIEVEQDLLRTTVLERVFAAWVREAALVGDDLGELLRGVSDIEHQWLWPGSEHVDPAKEANAQETRLRTGTTTLTRELAREGVDVDVHEQEQLRDVVAQVKRAGSILQVAKEEGVPEHIALAIALPQLSPLVLAGGQKPGAASDDAARGPQPIRDSEDGEEDADAA